MADRLSAAVVSIVLGLSPTALRAAPLADESTVPSACACVARCDEDDNFVHPVGQLPDTPAIDRTVESAALLERFKNENTFWRQFAIAQEIVARRDLRVLPLLMAWLSHEDRHVRGNAAFVFGGLGDSRGLQVIVDILGDRSDRPEGQGAVTASSDGRFRVQRQIASDRYYAAHLLGDLRDSRAVTVLVPLLTDTEVNATVPWALAQIGDRRAIEPLITALDDADPSMCVHIIDALESLKAREAIPRLSSLLDDHRKARFGAQVTVADAARAAIAKLQ